MKLSRYLRTRMRDGFTAIFHELHPNPVYCRSEEWQKFLHNPSDTHPLHDSLTQRKLLVLGEHEDEDALRLATTKLEQKLSQPTILYLMLARDCNFACTYCPVPGLAKTLGPARLSVSDMRQGLELWSQHLIEAASEESYIIFYGGEPLLNKETFFAALPLIANMQEHGQLPGKINLMVATNGVLIDESVIAACLKYDVLVALGLDGPKDANDAFRKHENGSGSFDEIVSTLTRLHANGIRTAVSASVTPRSIGRLQELKALLHELHISSIGFNFLKGQALTKLLPEDQHAIFEQMASAAVRNLYENGGNGPQEFQMSKKVDAFRKRDFFPVDCTCYGNQLVIRPDGHVSNCPFTQDDMGHVSTVGSSFRIAHTDTVARWRQRSPLTHPETKDNDAKSLCGTGCAFGAIEKGDLLTPDHALIDFASSVFDDLIWSEFQGVNHDTL